MRSTHLGFAVVTILLLCIAVGVRMTEGAQPPPYTRLISRNPGGEPGNALSEGPSVANEGRFVAFHSYAADLVASDTNGTSDIFVYDRQLGLMERVSLATGGSEGDGDSTNPMISPDGRYVVFESVATNLVAGDTNGLRDIFLHDRTLDTTVRVNLGPGGVQATGGTSSTPRVSTNADKIVYASAATNLIAGDNNVFTDIFVYTRASGTTERVSVPSAPGTAIPNGDSSLPSISAGGAFVAYSSVASNLVTGDNNDTCGVFSCADVFVRDLTANTTTLVSVRTGGIQGNAASVSPSISSDGRFITFESDSTNLDAVVPDTNLVTDIFLHDRSNGTTRRVNLGAGSTQALLPSTAPRISPDGNWIVFSTGSELVTSDTNGYTDVYRYSRASSTLQVASLPEGGGEANESSDKADLSGDGQRVVFWSEASNLVVNDTNAVRDVFIRTYLEDDATQTPTNTPTNTPTTTNTPTQTPTPSVTATGGTGGPPTLTPTGGATTRTPTRTRTPLGGGAPILFLPVIQRAP